jgi:hypothetical protein
MVEVGRNCHNCSIDEALVSIGFHYFEAGNAYDSSMIAFQPFCPVARHVRVAEEINTSGSGRITWEVQLGAPDG